MLSKKNKEKIIAVLEHRNYKSFQENFIAYPETVTILSQLVILANKYNIKISVVGSGSNPKTIDPEQEFFLLSTIKLNRIIDLDIDNLFINTGSGMVWSTLFTDLAEKSLYFPAKFNRSSQRTVGGIISTMDPFSSLVTFVKGFQFVSPTGEIINYGCKTLKNVSGYDLSKFMTGSCGMFGIITSVLLKLTFLDKTYTSIEDNMVYKSLKVKNNSSDLFKRLKKEIDPNYVLI